MRVLVTSIAVAAMVSLGAPPAGAQVGRAEFEALTKEVEALRDAVRAQQAARESQAAILDELREIKNLLRETLARGGRAAPGAPEAPPAEVVLSLDGRPARGMPAARLVLLEFMDLQ